MPKSSLILSDSLGIKERFSWPVYYLKERLNKIICGKSVKTVTASMQTHINVYEVEPALKTFMGGQIQCKFCSPEHGYGPQTIV